MKYRLMDLLACPIDKKFPLKLIVFQEEGRDIEFSHEGVVCELYCGLKGTYVKDAGLSAEDCKLCMRKEILNGLLTCSECSRWYPIVEEIPQLLPDDLRGPDEDLLFLKKHAGMIPIEILESGKPFNLKGKVES
ncbi:MAG: Trm112 family protein [Thermoproteota archaeon]